MLSLSATLLRLIWEGMDLLDTTHLWRCHPNPASPYRARDSHDHMPGQTRQEDASKWSHKRIRSKRAEALARAIQPERNHANLDATFRHVCYRADRLILLASQWFQRRSHLHLFGSVYPGVQAVGLHYRADGSGFRPVSHSASARLVHMTSSLYRADWV